MPTAFSGRRVSVLNQSHRVAWAIGRFGEPFRAMIAGRLIRWFWQAHVSIAWTRSIVGGALALYHLRNFSWPHDFHASLTALIQLSPKTGPAAIKL